MNTHLKGVLRSFLVDTYFGSFLINLETLCVLSNIWFEDIGIFTINSHFKPVDLQRPQCFKNYTENKKFFY